MTNKRPHISTLNVLARLIAGANSHVIAFDPGCTLLKDEDSDLVAITDKDALKQAINTNKGNICLFNCSNDPVGPAGIEYLVEFNTAPRYGGPHYTWHYIDNPDGTPRWIYPPRIKRPWFLAFYNFAYWKAMLYKLSVKMAFATGLRGLIFNGSIRIYTRNALFVENFLELSDKNERQYSIFTGTAGPNRKAVVAEVRDGVIRSFLKIALNLRSGYNICNEYETLIRLSGDPICDVTVPNVKKLHDLVIRVSNVSPVSSEKRRLFGPVELRFLSNLYLHSPGQQQYGQLGIVRDLREKLILIESNPHLEARGHAKQLFRKLRELDNSLSLLDPSVMTALCHGDFTPWNSYVYGKSLSVYDWEFSRPDMPILFDLFHYVIQGNVFSRNASEAYLQIQLELLSKNEDVSKLLRHLEIDFELYYKLYLLYNATYYLEVYLTQQNLHKEGYRLLQIWDGLLGNWDLSAPVEKKPCRSIFIQNFFQYLQPVRYVVLKSAGKSMEDLSEASDIDILIDFPALNEAIRWIGLYAGVAKITTVRRSFMTTIQLYFADAGFLSIDMLTDFHRKSFKYISTETMLLHAIDTDGVKLLEPAYDYLYIYLFYQLNNASVPEKYKTVFDHPGPDEDVRILSVLEKEAGIAPARLENSFSQSYEQKKKILNFLSSLPDNKLYKRLIRAGKHFCDRLLDLRRSKGMVVSFSGVDGAGKSTILSEIREKLQIKYRRKVVVLRHRPSLLPILSAWKYGRVEAEKRCIETLPRKGTNQSTLSSLARFAYYYLDYLVGQSVIYIKYILPGYVVLYDRYYFDFIADEKRSNIRISKSVVKYLYHFIYKPQLNIFLYARPDVILDRKKELNEKDIIELTENYKALFAQLGDPDKYICIENNDKQETIDRIEQAYISIN